MDEKEIELDIDLDDANEDAQEKINREKTRNRNLAEKVKAEREEKAKLEAERAKLAEEKATAEKNADFYKSFNTVSSKYQGASEYQDKIREKVMAGYDVEDATISILAKEGKYTPPPTPPAPKESPIGGSAVITPKTGAKEISELSVDEKREILDNNLILS